MTDQQKNRITILMLFGMTIIPFCIAGYFSTITPSKTTNHGELIIPVIQTQKTDLMGFDKFSTDNLQQLSAHWVIANVIPSKNCNKICQQAIYKSRQLHLMLNKDLTRVRRIVLLLDNITPQQAGAWWKEDNRLLKIKVNQTLMTKIKQLKKGNVPDGMLFLIDPMGNIMMQYEPNFDPYKVEKDLKKLLNVSQIG